MECVVVNFKLTINLKIVAIYKIKKKIVIIIKNLIKSH